jgi:hypothetical protein
LARTGHLESVDGVTCCDACLSRSCRCRLAVANPVLPSHYRQHHFCTSSSRKFFMNLTLSIGPLVSLIAGILILLMPKLLNFIVALYLIVIGLVGLFGLGSMRL